MVTFYINKTHKAHALADLVLALEGSIYIHCDDEAQARKLSDEIWSHPKHFIPNSLDPKSPDSIIQLGFSIIPKRSHIINASKQFVSTANIEWVSDNVSEAREHYREFKQQSKEVITHQL